MKRFCEVVFVIALTLAVTAAWENSLAADGKPSAPSKDANKSGKIIKQKDSKAKSKKSKSGRVESGGGTRTLKSHSLNGRAGSIMGNLVGGGLEYYYHVSESLQFGLEVAYGQATLEAKLEESRYQTDSAYTDVSMGLLLARYFWGHSFYSVTGLGIRTVGAYYQFSDGTSNNYLDATASGQAVILHAGVGNLWTFASGFNLGAEWLGVSVPLVSSHKWSIQAQGSVDEAIVENSKVVEDRAVWNARTTSLYLCKVTLGISF